MNTRPNFSPITPIRSRFAPAGERLLLGLTARHVRRDPATYNLGSVSPISGLRRTSSLLDRLQSPLTRYHD
jgi:hypothetical protein